MHFRCYFTGKFQNCRNSTVAWYVISNTAYIFKSLKIAIWPRLRWQDIQDQRKFCKTPTQKLWQYSKMLWEPFLLLICLPGSRYSMVLLNTPTETANTHNLITATLHSFQFLPFLNSSFSCRTVWFSSLSVNWQMHRKQDQKPHLL